jgi:hypothetical protein
MSKKVIVCESCKCENDCDSSFCLCGQSIFHIPPTEKDSRSEMPENSDKVLICDSCKRENDCNLSLCEGCGQPISHILPTGKAIKSEMPMIASNGANEKTCSKCGTKEPSYRLTCRNCGEKFLAQKELKNDENHSEADNSAVLTSQVCSQKLLLRINEQEFDLSDGDYLGREGDAAVSSFLVFGEVSRKHARVHLRDAVWYISGLSANITEVDGKILDKGELHALAQGSHRVRLSTKCEIMLEVK